MQAPFRVVKEKYCGLSSVAKATFWFFFCNILIKCISMVTTPIFTRILPTEEFGVFNTFQSWNMILTILVTLRLDYGVFNKGMSLYADHREDYTATMQCLTTFLALLALSVYLVFQHQINRITGLTTFLTVALFAQVLFYSAIPFWNLRQRYDFRYKSVVFVTLSMSLLQTVLGIFGVLITGHKSIGRILPILLVNICFGMGIYIYNFHKADRCFVKEYAKFALIFNLPLLPHYFSSYILDQFDRIMIQHMVGYSAVGIYGIAYSSGYVIKIITSSLNTTLIPWMYRQLEHKQFLNLQECIGSITHCVLVSFMGYMAFAPEVIRIFAPAEYRLAVYAVSPLAATAFLIFLYELYANIELFYNSNKFSMYIAISGAALNVLLNYICIPRFGFLAAAYTTLASYLYFAVCHYLYMNHVTRNEIGQRLFSVSGFCFQLIVITVYASAINLLYPHTFLRYTWIGLMLLYTFVQRKKLFKFIQLLR